MTKLTVNRTDFLGFLNSFTKGMQDLRLQCAGARIVVEVGFSQYYLRKNFLGANIEEEGVIHIALLDKMVRFLKASKQDLVYLRQLTPVKPLHIEAGANKLQIPSTDDITSASKTVVMGDLASKCAKSGWTKFYKAELIAHGTIPDTKDLVALAGMKGLIADSSQYKLRVHCGENELGIVAGKAASGRLFTSLPIRDTDGPCKTIQSFFGEWLPTCLQYLDNESARFHIGDGTLVVFEQRNTLLMIIDEGED